MYLALGMSLKKKASQLQFYECFPKTYIFIKMYSQYHGCIYKNYSISMNLQKFIPGWWSRWCSLTAPDLQVYSSSGSKFHMFSVSMQVSSGFSGLLRPSKNIVQIIHSVPGNWERLGSTAVALTEDERMNTANETHYMNKHLISF